METDCLSRSELIHATKGERELTVESPIDDRTDLHIVAVVHEVCDADRWLGIKPQNHHVDRDHLPIGEGIVGAGVTTDWADGSG